MTTHDSTADSLAQARIAEKKAARSVTLGAQGLPLILSVVGFALSLPLVVSAGVRGWAMLGSFSQMTLMEYVFYLFSAIGAVATVSVLLTRRTVLAQIAWMCVTLGFFLALWAFWASSRTGGAGLGFLVTVLANACAMVAYALLIMRKSPEQQAAERRVRELARELDLVGQVQEAARHAEAAPQLADDRRAQAAHRHQRARNADS
ncbi:hypothetical protein G7Y31_07185 [Corynebacterium lizhenjunii]|uniref:Uncharacterized protein n=1 Tax=Corynebacterium lizhenjunii TaxID=2709394 RepID=A0A7T0PBB1_9CORY|nr:hypothetical protein [Corynebacterium lizhenjunii]QPK78362.1 hypothetical protein G7Y31_07185 [Corynebacterium lizhenjunii]